MVRGYPALVITDVRDLSKNLCPVYVHFCKQNIVNDNVNNKRATAEHFGVNLMKDMLGIDHIGASNNLNYKKLKRALPVNRTETASESAK